ncbi:MAG TPA: OB-fold domain-containing protein [Candidatus Thermoplasmatota archaeon]
MRAAETARGPSTVAEALASARQGQLVGRRCAHCRRASFTVPVICRGCGGTDFERFVSSGEGEVVSFTIIGFPAEPFAGRAPYAFAIARMSEGALAAGWVPGVRDPLRLPPGTRVRVVTAPAGLGLCFEIR